MGNWMFVYKEIWAAVSRGQPQQEQLSVLGLDPSINKQAQGETDIWAVRFDKEMMEWV